MKILIIGASGFIGSFIVEEALRRGFDTWAGVRSTSSRKYLRDSRIRFLELDFDSEDMMASQLAGHDFDYIVDAAGATKCRRSEDFFRINADGTRRIVNAVLRSCTDVRKFVYLSSLSVYGAVHEEEPHVDISDADLPCPNTCYGMSKLEAEQYLFGVRDRLNYVVLRPTGVYGPREKDYFMMVKSIKRHFDFAVGFSRQDITFVYVTDVVDAVFLSLGVAESGRSYFLSDGEVYGSAAFSDFIRRELGGPRCVRLTMPLSVMRAVCAVGDACGRITGSITALNSDKYHILAQRNWRCDIAPAMADLGYSPKVKLQEGVARTVEWYRQSGWI